MNEIDWSEAPAWATSFGFAGTSKVPVWYNLKQYQPVSGVQANLVFSFGERVNWSLCDIELIEYRPTKPDEHNDSTEWVDGLPPVGEECEIIFHDDDHPSWFEIEFCGMAKGKPVIHDLQLDKTYVSDSKNYEFRPTQTPEQRMWEELFRLVTENYDLPENVTNAILSKYNLTEKEK